MNRKDIQKNTSSKGYHHVLKGITELILEICHSYNETFINNTETPLMKKKEQKEETKTNNINVSSFL